MIIELIKMHYYFAQRITHLFAHSCLQTAMAYRKEMSQLWVLVCSDVFPDQDLQCIADILHCKAQSHSFALEAPVIRTGKRFYLTWKKKPVSYASALRYLYRIFQGHNVSSDWQLLKEEDLPHTVSDVLSCEKAPVAIPTDHILFRLLIDAPCLDTNYIWGDVAGEGTFGKAVSYTHLTLPTNREV